MTLEALRLLRDTTFFWTRRRASHLHAHQESLNVASFVYKYAVVYCLYLIGSQPNLLLLFFPPGDDFVGDKVLNVLSRHTRRFALGDSFCIIFISLSPPRWRACACHQPRVDSRTWSWSIAGYTKKKKRKMRQLVIRFGALSQSSLLANCFHKALSRSSIKGL